MRMTMWEGGDAREVSPHKHVHPLVQHVDIQCGFNCKKERLQMNNKCTIFLRNQFKIKHQQPNIFSSRQSIDSPRYSIKDKASTAQHTMLLRRRAQSAVERRGAGKASGRQNLGDCGARGRGGRRGGPRAPRERDLHSLPLSNSSNFLRTPLPSYESLRSQPVICPSDSQARRVINNLRLFTCLSAWLS